MKEEYKLEYLHVLSGTKVKPTAIVILRLGDHVLTETGCGNGPIDAAFQTIDRMIGVSGQLIDYLLKPTDIGREAPGQATVRVTFKKINFVGRGISTDIIEASAQAYLSCVNKFLASQHKAKPAA